MQWFVDVILPLPLNSCFTYALPETLAGNVQVGCRVVVPFGKKKFYTGIVQDIHCREPEGYEVKDVADVLDARPVLLASQFKLWDWVADYYLCTRGDVYKAALPSGLKLESEPIVAFNPDFEPSGRLSEREQKVLSQLESEGETSVTCLEKSCGVKNMLTLVKSLLDKEAIMVKEELKRTYKPRTEVRVRLTAAARNEHRLHFFFDELQRRAPKQLDLLMRYLELSGSLGGSSVREVSKAELLQRAQATPAVFNGLVEKGILEIYKQEVGRLDNSAVADLQPLNPLNVHQEKAYHAIINVFHQKNVCLLYGVTASGKTEIYIHLIAETIRRGRQVLYLLPEIALTAQITARLRRVFGARLGIYHSKFPDAERVEIWQKQLSGQDYDIILGVRSSVFLPFRRLGLVIVDEEHENTYKQQDPAPRYHARNAAIMLASYYGAKTLLGTATPSLESWYNAGTGKYGLVELKDSVFLLMTEANIRRGHSGSYLNNTEDCDRYRVRLFDGRLPVADGWADLLLNVFSPWAGAEFARMLRPGGVLLYAVPTPRHLFGLKALVYAHPYENTEQETDYPGFTRLGARTVEGRLRLGGDAARQLFAMTPYAFRTPADGLARLAACDCLETEIGFRFLAYRRDMPRA